MFEVESAAATVPSAAPSSRRWEHVVADLLSRSEAPAASTPAALLLLLDRADGSTGRTFVSLTERGGRVSGDQPLDPDAETTIVLGLERDWEALLFTRDAHALRRLRFYGDSRPLQQLSQRIRIAAARPQAAMGDLWH